MYNLRNQKIDFAYHPQYITEEVHNGKLQRSRTEVGDLIMNIVGPPLGKLAIIPTTLPQANFNQAAVLIRPYKFKEVLVSYLTYIIHSGFISGYQNRYGDNLKPPTNVYHRMTA